MIKINEKLTIFHDDNSVFAEYSDELLGFDRDAASLTFITAEDSIYVGFYKPINIFFSELATTNTNDADLTVEYYNGTAFTNVVGLHDDSKAFTRSGFTRWDRNQADEAATTINSVELFWYKIDLDADSSAMVFDGLNIVFSDDQDLKRELFEIDKYLPANTATHILSHASARDEIIQKLNIMGKDKNNAVTGWLEGITAFDLLDISEVKLASTYLVLSKILFSVSDDLDDVFASKSITYRSMADNIINSTKLSVDSNDNGVEEQNEAAIFTVGRILRL